MSDRINDYGLLINKDIKLHRLYFKQMVKLLGINCKYRYPLSGKDYDLHGDLEAKYADGETVNFESLVMKGLLKKANLPVKILGDGEVTKKLTVAVEKVSASAKDKIEKAGGSVVPCAKTVSEE